MMDKTVLWGISGPYFASSLPRMVKVSFAKYSPKQTSKNPEILNAAIAQPQMQTVYGILEIIFASGHYFNFKDLFIKILVQFNFLQNIDFEKHAFALRNIHPNFAQSFGDVSPHFACNSFLTEKMKSRR